MILWIIAVHTLFSGTSANATDEKFTFLKEGEILRVRAPYDGSIVAPVEWITVSTAVRFSSYDNATYDQCFRREVVNMIEEEYCGIQDSDTRSRSSRSGFRLPFNIGGAASNARPVITRPRVGSASSPNLPSVASSASFAAHRIHPQRVRGAADIVYRPPPSSGNSAWELVRTGGQYLWNNKLQSFVNVADISFDVYNYFAVHRMIRDVEREIRDGLNITLEGLRGLEDEIVCARMVQVERAKWNSLVYGGFLVPEFSKARFDRSIEDTVRVKVVDCKRFD
ncbi:hypothetical protein PENTCL1PPCAC_3952, partial [Pristionchus entomophagus]